MKPFSSINALSLVPFTFSEDIKRKRCYRPRKNFSNYQRKTVLSRVRQALLPLSISTGGFACFSYFLTYKDATLSKATVVQVIKGLPSRNVRWKRNCLNVGSKRKCKEILGGSAKEKFPFQPRRCIRFEERTIDRQLQAKLFTTGYHLLMEKKVHF